jgi:hypothetical protein
LEYEEQNGTLSQSHALPLISTELVETDPPISEDVVGELLRIG